MNIHTYLILSTLGFISYLQHIYPFPKQSSGWTAAKMFSLGAILWRPLKISEFLPPVLSLQCGEGELWEQSNINPLSWGSPHSRDQPGWPLKATFSQSPVKTGSSSRQRLYCPVSPPSPCLQISALSNKCSIYQVWSYYYFRLI